MTRSKAAEIYRQYFGVSRRTANVRVKLIFNSEGDEKAQRFFAAIEDSLRQQAQKAFYAD